MCSGICGIRSEKGNRIQERENGKVPGSLGLFLLRKLNDIITKNH